MPQNAQENNIAAESTVEIKDITQANSRTDALKKSMEAYILLNQHLTQTHNTDISDLLKSFKQAEAVIKNISRTPLCNDEIRYFAQFYVFLGLLHVANQNIEASLPYFDEAIELISTIDIDSVTSTDHICRSHYYLMAAAIYAQLSKTKLADWYNDAARCIQETCKVHPDNEHLILCPALELKEAHALLNRSKDWLHQFSYSFLHSAHIKNYHRVSKHHPEQKINSAWSLIKPEQLLMKVPEKFSGH